MLEETEVQILQLSRPETSKFQRLSRRRDRTQSNNHSNNNNPANNSNNPDSRKQRPANDHSASPFLKRKHTLDKCQVQVTESVAQHNINSNPSSGFKSGITLQQYLMVGTETNSNKPKRGRNNVQSQVMVSQQPEDFDDQLLTTNQNNPAIDEKDEDDWDALMEESAPRLSNMQADSKRSLIYEQSTKFTIRNLKNGGGGKNSPVPIPNQMFSSTVYRNSEKKRKTMADFYKPNNNYQAEMLDNQDFLLRKYANKFNLDDVVVDQRASRLKSSTRRPQAVNPVVPPVKHSTYFLNPDSLPIGSAGLGLIRLKGHIK